MAAGQKTARENARNFLRMDVLTPEQIAQGTGLLFFESVLSLGHSRKPSIKFIVCSEI